MGIYALALFSDTNNSFLYVHLMHSKKRTNLRSQLPAVYNLLLCVREPDFDAAIGSSAVDSHIKQFLFFLICVVGCR